MKPLLRTALLAFGLAISLPLAAHAEQILHLRDGSVLHGRVVSSANGVLVFETANGRLQIPESQVERIDFAGEAAPPAGPAAPPAGPGATPPPSQPGPEGGPAPQAERTPWPTATPTPEPPSAYGPPPTYGPPPRRVVRQPPRRWERPTPTDGPLWLEGKVGVHTYSGTGWSSFGTDRTMFDGPALEGTARLLLDRSPDIRFDFVSSLGIYGGTDDCLAGPGGTCVQMTITNFYGDVGGRATFNVEPFYVYGQAGVGLMSSTVDIQSDTGVLESESRGSPSAHFLGGIGVALEPFDLFGEVKYTASQAHFDILGQDLGMGGTTAVVGVGMHF